MGSDDNPQCLSKTDVLMPTPVLARMIARHVDAGEYLWPEATGQSLYKYVSSSNESMKVAQTEQNLHRGVLYAIGRRLAGR